MSLEIIKQTLNLIRGSGDSRILVEQTALLNKEVRGGMTSFSEEKIKAVANEIQQVFCEHLKDHAYTTSIAGGSTEVSQVVAELGNTLLKLSQKDAQECGKELLQSYRPRLPKDAYLEIIRNLSSKDKGSLRCVSKEEKINDLISLVNHWKTPLKDLGLKTVTEAMVVFGEFGKEINYLNLRRLEVSDDDCKILKEFFPNIIDLIVNSKIITDEGIFHLKEMGLRKVNLSSCNKLTNVSLSYLKAMPITRANFSWCKGFTREGLANLDVSNLKKLILVGCPKIDVTPFEKLGIKVTR